MDRPSTKSVSVALDMASGVPGRLGLRCMATLAEIQNCGRLARVEVSTGALTNP